MSDHLGESLSALADGQLDDAESEAARRHLAGCEPCTAELAGIDAVRTMVRALPPVDPRRPLVAVAPQQRRPGRLAGALAAAAASVAMVLLAGVERDAGTGPQVAQLVQFHAASPLNADVMSQVVPAALPVSFQR